jgi:hypothetical protein
LHALITAPHGVAGQILDAVGGIKVFAAQVRREKVI